MELLDDELEFSPEKRLIVAVLLQAVRDAYYPRFDKCFTFESQRDDAIDWLHSDSMEPYSYKWIKQILNIEHKTDVEILKQVLKNQIETNGLKANKFNIENVPEFCIIKGTKLNIKCFYKKRRKKNDTRTIDNRK